MQEDKIKADNEKQKIKEILKGGEETFINLH
jgi:hypothetical protein